MWRGSRDGRESGSCGIDTVSAEDEDGRERLEEGRGRVKGIREEDDDDGAEEEVALARGEEEKAPLKYPATCVPLPRRRYTKYRSLVLAPNVCADQYSANRNRISMMECSCAKVKASRLLGECEARKVLVYS